MTTYKIWDPTEKYTTSYFVITTCGIYVDNEELGFFKHPTIDTKEKLYQHLSKMVHEGFRVDTFE